MATARRALIVTSGRDRGSLAAVRALDQAGWFVGVGTPTGKGMVSASRRCGRRHVIPRPRGDGRCFVSAVRCAVVDGGYDVVFGGGDDWMAALATYRDDIPVAVAHPPADVALHALDKLRLAQGAAAARLHAPRTTLTTASALDAWKGPVVVKCRAHWQPNQRHELRIEARRYPNVWQAADRIRLIAGAGFEPLLQEPIEGTLEALVGLVHERRLLGRVQQQSLALWPTPSGVTCRARTVPVDEDLAIRATALLSDLGWSGLVQLQFLRTADGVPYLIDLNGRFFGSMALANAAGPNLPDAWGRQVLGEALPTLDDARPGVRFLWGAGDIRRAWVERRGGVLADVGSTLRWFPGAVTSVWDVRDPGPTLSLVADRLSPWRRPASPRP